MDKDEIRDLIFLVKLYRNTIDLAQEARVFGDRDSLNKRLIDQESLEGQIDNIINQEKYNETETICCKA